MALEIAGYSVGEKLNQGPISTVYRAHQIALQREVLIKRLNPQWMNEADLLERFRREAIICARLKHKNIVSIIDVNTDPDNLYLVIEFIDGLNLKQLIRQSPPLSYEAVRYLLHEVLDGLAYAHRSGIIHRDIKPSNIMISREGDVKITDFGLARAQDLPPLTVHGGVVGTPSYLSPEQAQVSGLDHRTDLFSLAITAYEMCGVTSPFRAESLVESIRKLVNETPAPLSEAREDIPQDFAQLMLRMLEKKPGDRPDSAEAVLASGVFRSTPVTRQSLLSLLPATAGSQPVVPAEPVRAKPGRPAATLSAVLISLLLLISLAWMLISGESDQPIPTSTFSADSTGGVQLTRMDTLPPPDDRNEKIINASRQEPPPENAASTTQSNLPPEDETASPAANIEGNDAGATGLVGADSLAAETVLPANAGLMVECLPWAEIYIDGVYHETTPIRQPLLVQPGPHEVELRNPAFKPVRRVLDLEANRTDTLRIRFRRNEGMLSLEVFPWAKVYINGRYLDTTPLTTPLSLAAGRHELTLINPGFSTWRDSITIQENATTIRRITLQEAGG